MTVDSATTTSSAANSGVQPRALAWGRLGLVTLQLAAVVAVIYRFRIEERFGLLRLMPLIAGGFLVHALAPRAWRPWLFVALSLAGIGLVVPFPHSALLVVVALGLIALVHLPVPFALRVALLLAVAAVFAGIRLGRVPHFGWEAFPIQVLPLLGAMFMFRLAVYVYDLRHEKTPVPWATRLGYFFLLPNPVFPLFPVVDYQTFRRTYYDTDAYAIYEKGVLWMLRGTVHLLLYRLIYQYFVPPAGDIRDFASVVQFMLTTYLLYLRVSGLFHLIVGILCLFGFNLPETHHRYYLASSFNDLWRRINIYWKDFMMKMLYYPTFTALKGLGLRWRMVLATVVVFAGTWVLHSYQYFWLQGTFLLTGPDAVFWGLLGGLVVINSLWEASRPKARTLGRPAWAWGRALHRSAQTVAMFVTMTVLWSMWSSSSFGEWLTVIGRGRVGLAPGLAWLALALLGAVAVGVLWQRWGSAGLSFDSPTAPRARPLVTGLALPLGLLLLSLPAVGGRLGPIPAATVANLRQERMNARDKELVDRGYYEGLLVSSQFALTGTGGQGDDGRPQDGTWVQLRTTPMALSRNDLMGYELKPLAAGTFKSFPFETNEWGMRDDSYERAKLPGTLRLGLPGSSYETAGGLPHAASYEARLEARLNAEPPSSQWSRYELLNFSVDGYSMLHKLMVYEQRLPGFDVDVALLTLYSTEDNRLLIHLTEAVADGVPIPYPALADIVRRSGATSRMASSIIRERLRPFIDEALNWSLEEFRRAEARGGPRLVTVLIPRTTMEADDEENWDQLWAAAVAAGLEPLSVRHAFDGLDPSTIRIAPWDDHPNVRGHQALADALYDVLTTTGALTRAATAGADRPPTGRTPAPVTTSH